MTNPAEKLDRGPNASGMWRGPDTAAPTPISEIGPKFRPHVARHLLRLNTRDRYLRFGYVASDEQIQRYVNSLNFERDHVYAIFDHALEVVGMAHLAFAVSDEQRAAEFGVSVTKEFRGRGWGKRLFERAAVHAVNSGIDTLYIYALSENATMLHIARKAGAIIEQEGGDSEARVRLPRATFASCSAVRGCWVRF